MKRSNLYIYSFSLIAFVVVFLLLDRFCASEISKAVIARQCDNRISMLIDGKIDYDFLVMGSSRAARNIDPSDLSAYSLAYPGVNIDFQETVLRLVVASAKIPKKILLSVDDDFEVIDKNAITYRYDLIYPYIYYEPVREILCKKGVKNCFIGVISKSYVQNLNIDEALSYFEYGALVPDWMNIVDFNDGSMLLDIQSVEFQDNGFLGEVKPYDKNLENPLLVEKLLSFIDICKKNRIELYILFPPIFREETPLFEDRIKELCGDYPKYLDFSDRFRDKKFFYDTHHLLSVGAEILTKEISDKIL